MPRAKKIEASAEHPAGVEATAEEVRANGQPTDHIDIIDEAGNLIRTYSLEVHGEKFMGLADELLAGHAKYSKR